MAGIIKADTIYGESSLRLNVGEVTLINVNATAFNVAQPLNVQTNATVTGNLIVQTNATVTGNLNVQTNATVTGNLIVIGRTTTTGLQTFTGSTSNASLKVFNILEAANVSATAATGTINYDVTTQSVLFFTTNASGNFTVNFRGSSGTSLNTVMATGESLSVTFLVTNGATAYYNSAVQIDGSSVTPKFQGGTAPTSGNANSIDSYTYVIIKTASATYTVIAAQTRFA